MVDILFAHANFLKNDPKQVKKMRPYPPLATLYAASYLRQAGYSVALFDAMFADSEADFAQALARYQPRFVALYEDSFNFLSKMCLSRHRESGFRLAEMARRTGATVVAYGPDVSGQPGIYFQHGVQYALIGEGEQTLREILDHLTGRGRLPLEQIPGLAFPAPASRAWHGSDSPAFSRAPSGQVPPARLGSGGYRQLPPGLAAGAWFLQSESGGQPGLPVFV